MAKWSYSRSWFQDCDSLLCQGLVLFFSHCFVIHLCHVDMGMLSLGKFSIRLVPNLTVASVTDLVVKYVEEEFKKLGSKNKMEVYLTHGGEPWIVSGSPGWLMNVKKKADNGFAFRLTPT